MRETVTYNNPLVGIRCTDETTPNNMKNILAHLNTPFDMNKTVLCWDAMVDIKKVNIEPKWGLYNGANAHGWTSFFERGPNEGHLPTIVVVDLKHYRGSVWDDDNPTRVPIVPIQRQCEPMCCTRNHVPLQIAWAKTVHSPQGHNDGPTANN
jgi:hypothetical protein